MFDAMSKKQLEEARSFEINGSNKKEIRKLNLCEQKVQQQKERKVIWMLMWVKQKSIARMRRTRLIRMKDRRN